MKQLEDAILITGGSKGIGRACIGLFLKAKKRLLIFPELQETLVTFQMFTIFLVI